MKKIELLAPAGNLERLKMAIIYGADAVYIGGEEYSLRANADNFSFEDMKEGIKFAHDRNKKVYLTMNVIPHNEDICDMDEYIKSVCELGVDAIILSDPGVYTIVKENAPDIDIHLSTQANNTNWRSVKFWYDNGVRRVVLARELTLVEINQIREKLPQEMELEIFVHGAMCISYSGRCLLSNYMTNRDSNRGACSHPCRWQYHLMEEKRPGEYFPVYENERGTFVFNSKDLCMLEHIPEIVESGVKSLKIEGRMKSSFYVATVIKAYREAIDSYEKDPLNYTFNENLIDEIKKVSHREFTTGFYLKDKENQKSPEEKSENLQQYNSSSYIRNYDFVGLVLEYDEGSKIAKVEQRNRLYLGEEVEVVRPSGDYFVQKIEYMQNEELENIEVAPHAQMILYIKMDEKVSEYTMIRKKN